MRKVSDNPFRKCLVCEETKEKSEFEIPSDVKTGRGRNTCNYCRISQIRKWADENRQAVNENQRNYNKTLHGRTNLLYHGARTRAKDKNQLFLLTKEHVYNGIKSGYCQKTLFPFDFNTHGKGWMPFSPSIDKINPDGIYEPDNVQYVCWWYNIAKQNWSEDIVIQFCKRIASLYP